MIKQVNELGGLTIVDERDPRYKVHSHISEGNLLTISQEQAVFNYKRNTVLISLDEFIELAAFYISPQTLREIAERAENARG